MLEEYIYKGSKRLRCGYTTGSCAAAAAKAAAEMLLTGKLAHETELMTPKGIVLKLEIYDQAVGDGYASCSVIKDSGDDPDITDGIRIFARVSPIQTGVEIVGGEGIGIVTKKGLDQPVGEAAINSVPRKMIAAAVGEISEKYGYCGGFEILISVPNGAEIAKKTYNPRMGIEGGISIIGTTGIVEPMSSSALIETIRTEARMRKAEGWRNLIVTVGNYSEEFLKNKLPFLNDRSVTCSNFIGEAVDIGLEMGFESILIVGHIGKLVKLGAGIMNTHSSVADGRMEILVTCGVLAGADTETLIKLPECVTVDAALDILNENGYMNKTLEILADRIDLHLKARVQNKLKIGAIAFSFKNDVCVKTKEADCLLKIISEE